MNKQLWKKAGLRALIGAPIGLAISIVITIIISLAMGDGKYYAVVPELTADLGSEIGAVVVQTLCSMLYGAAFAGAAVIWDTDWNLTKMTVIHFLICSAATFPIAYLMICMEPRIRFERIAYRLQGDCATIAPARHKMVGREGVEPS